MGDSPLWTLCLAIASENVIVISIELALLLQRSPQAVPGPVNSDLRGRQRTRAYLGHLLGIQAFKVMQNERRTVVLGQAVDDLPHAGVHLVYDDPFIDPAVRGRYIRSFVHLDNLESALGCPEMVGGDARGDRERPRLHAGPAGEAGKSPRYPDQRFLQEVFSHGPVSNGALEIAQEGLRKFPGERFERMVLEGAHPAISKTEPYAAGSYLLRK